MVAAFNKIPFAIREADRKIVSIEDVPRGLACACRCPSCDARLQARKGDVNEHHFAHHDSSAELCEFALETSIRLMLLETLGQIQSISTPVFLWGKETIIRGRENVALTFDLDLSQGNWLITSCRSANNIMPITFFLPAFIASSFYSA